MPLAPTPLRTDSTRLGVKGLDLEDVDALLGELKLERGVPPVHHRFRGGTSEALRLLRTFVSEHLPPWRRAGGWTGAQGGHGRLYPRGGHPRGRGEGGRSPLRR
ncbi:hypothetical protein BON30_35410 [Cystobacter ferrugineus]|uniref:Uncharacterized protein n=1 Tax=Cystobacter ferrugineus TaxID=83449 RepID=A0A1L9B0W9_9BACT|nr:hypothetical protein BON30_35410 [Cystobacter ferrugineus]